MKKYMLWEMIPYEGYWASEYETWEEVQKKVEVIIQARKSQELLVQYKSWLAGKLPKIQHYFGKGKKRELTLEIFVTTMPLTGPLGET